MNQQDLFELGITAAESGNKEQALSIFIQIVDENPYHEDAWMWLSDLVSNAEDRIIALENVLTVNPANEDARILVDTLKRARTNNASEASKPSTPVFTAVPTEPLRSHGTEEDKVHSILSDTNSPTQPAQDRKVRDARTKSQFMAIERALNADDLNAVLSLLVQMVEEDEYNERAWYLLGVLAPAREDQLVALENALVLNPENKNAKKLRNDLEEDNNIQDGPFWDGKNEAYRVVKEYFLTLNKKPKKSEKQTHARSTQKEGQSPGLVKDLLLNGLRATAIFAVIVGATIFLTPMKFGGWMFFGAACIFVGSILTNISSMSPRHPTWIEFFGSQGDTMDRIASWTIGGLGWILLLSPIVVILRDIIQFLISLL